MIAVNVNRPGQRAVNKQFLLNAGKPIAVGPYSVSNYVMEARKNQEIALENAKEVIADVAEKYRQLTDLRSVIHRKVTSGQSVNIIDRFYHHFVLKQRRLCLTSQWPAISIITFTSVHNRYWVYDNFIQAYPIAENPSVHLPVMICQDGFITSHAVENIVPAAEPISIII